MPSNAWVFRYWHFNGEVVQYLKVSPDCELVTRHSAFFKLHIKAAGAVGVTGRFTGSELQYDASHR